jgi:hypothetical protein
MGVMRNFMRFLFFVFSISAIGVNAQASVIIAQLIDENPSIKGLAYQDGVLIQDNVLAEETYADRFTGFLVIDPFSRPLDYFSLFYNVYAPGDGDLVAVLGLSGGPDWPLIHTAYYSAYPGSVLYPAEFPTAKLIADSNFHTVLQFYTDNGDEYIFQYKNIYSEIPEPQSTLIFLCGLIALLALRRKPF